MRKHTLLILLFTCFCSACYGGEKAPSSLAGEWLLQGTVNQSSPVECPDLLTLKQDGSYLVSNDCYGVDMRNPVTEEGGWVFSGSKNLVLENRTFEGNYFFGGDSSDPLAIEVVQVSEEKLVLQFNSGDPEAYKNIKR